MDNEEKHNIIGLKKSILGKAQSRIIEEMEWNDEIRKLGNGLEFIKKACFVCGSFNHLIKDYDFHDKKIVEKAVLNNKGRATGQREIRPVWNNAHRADSRSRDFGLVMAPAYDRKQVFSYRFIKRLIDGGFVAFVGSPKGVTQALKGDAVTDDAGKKTNEEPANEDEKRVQRRRGALNKKIDVCYWVLLVVHFDDEDVGAEADLNNLETTMNVSPIPTTRIHKDHTKDQIIGDINSATQTKKDDKISEEHANGQVYIQNSRAIEGQSGYFWHYAFIMGFIYCNRGCEELPFYIGRKAFYGLHQAPKAWYETLSTYLLENGIQKIAPKDITFSSRRSERFTDWSSMRELTFFLGLQVMQKDDGIFISQDKYVADILKKFDFVTIKTASTPIEINKALLKDEEAVDVDVHLYRSLMYLTASRPDIMFAVCACARIFPQIGGKVSMDFQKSKLDYGVQTSWNTKIYIDNDAPLYCQEVQGFISKTSMLLHSEIRLKYCGFKKILIIGVRKVNLDRDEGMYHYAEVVCDRQFLKKRTQNLEESHKGTTEISLSSGPIPLVADEDWSIRNRKLLRSKSKRIFMTACRLTVYWTSVLRSTQTVKGDRQIQAPSKQEKEDASKQERKIEDLDADAEQEIELKRWLRAVVSVCYNYKVIPVSVVAIVTNASASVTKGLWELYFMISGRTSALPPPHALKIFSSSQSQLPQVKDKGKGKMVEPEVPLKKKDQVALDEEMARNLEAQLQAKLIEEERLARQKEEEANIALIES
ncbi:hypothetical protein Tco_0178449 [Tanacetum coccineum]